MISIGRNQKLLMIKFEDLLADPFEQLSTMLDFIKISVPQETINRAVEKSSFNRMRAIEKERGRAFQKNDHVKNFIRKGQSGDWKNLFGEDEKKIFISNEGDALIRLGYEENNMW
jgi:hypothetical protein